MHPTAILRPFERGCCRRRKIPSMSVGGGAASSSDGCISSDVLDAESPVGSFMVLVVVNGRLGHASD